MKINQESVISLIDMTEKLE